MSFTNHKFIFQHSEDDRLSIAESVEPVNADRPYQSAQPEAQELIRRELKLMSSAWANLNKRIQSDAVIVQRRRQTPSSFLNRQRRILRQSSTGELHDPL